MQSILFILHLAIRVIVLTTCQQSIDNDQSINIYHFRQLIDLHIANRLSSSMCPIFQSSPISNFNDSASTLNVSSSSNDTVDVDNNNVTPVTIDPSNVSMDMVNNGQPIATFDEWTKEKMRQDHRSTATIMHVRTDSIDGTTLSSSSSAPSLPQVGNDASPIGGANGHAKASTTLLIDSTLTQRNYASKECGAKVLVGNPEAENVGAVLNEKERDEYMRNPCDKAKSKFVLIELCDTIQPTSIHLANLELFSSGPKDIRVSASDRYPTNEWTLIGDFVANDTRTMQQFAVSSRIYVKFMKIELLSHYGHEHYCTLTVIRVFGISMVDEWQYENDGRVTMVQVVEQQQPQEPPNATIHHHHHDKQKCIVPFLALIRHRSLRMCKSALAASRVVEVMPKPMATASKIEQPVPPPTPQQLPQPTPTITQSPPPPIVVSPSVQQPPASPPQPPSTPASTNGQQQLPVIALPGYSSNHKESVFVKLNNRIRQLELNISLSSQYLNELSLKYVNQMDEIRRQYERTNRIANETNRVAGETRSQLTDRIEQLHNAVDLLRGMVIDQQQHQQQSDMEHCRHLIVEELKTMMMTTTAAATVAPPIVTDTTPVIVYPSIERLWTNQQVIGLIISVQLVTCSCLIVALLIVRRYNQHPESIIIDKQLIRDVVIEQIRAQQLEQHQVHQQADRLIEAVVNEKKKKERRRRRKHTRTTITADAEACDSAMESSSNSNSIAPTPTPSELSSELELMIPSTADARNFTPPPTECQWRRDGDEEERTPVPEQRSNEWHRVTVDRGRAITTTNNHRRIEHNQPIAIDDANIYRLLQSPSTSSSTTHVSCT